MSKFLNFALPAAGGTALALGGAFAFATANYGEDRIATLDATVTQQRSAVAEGTARIAALEAALVAADDEAEANRAAAEAAEADAADRIAKLVERIETAGDAGAIAALDTPAAAAPTGALGLGREAAPEEVAAWDVDVLPDGRGLPEGAGDVWTGEEVFGAKCASCHGDFAEGRGAWPVLAGGFNTLADADPVKTVGSYWPYLSTVWDYVHRSMPFGNAGTLTDDEVYAITAYILYSNDLVDEDFTLSKDSFLEVEMNNTDGFIVDDRASAEYAAWRAEPCMTDCKDGPAEITRRSTDVGVTPADDGSMADSPMEEQLALLGGTEWGKERVAGSVFMGPGGVMMDEPAEETASVAPAAEPASVAADTPDPALVAKGEVAFKKCSACHQVGAGAKNRSGPQLNGVLGRTIGGLDDFKYSNPFKDAHSEGRVWDEDSLAAFLADPRSYIKGTRMSFRGFSNQADVDAVVAYLSTFE